MPRRLAAAALAAILAALAAGPASAAEFEVKMLNKGESGTMVFEPTFVRVQPGDTVVFKSVDPSHNAESIPGMIPEGAEPFKGRIGKDLAVTFETEGVYGVKCLPHYGLGMVGLIVVGDPTVNLTEASKKNHPGKARKLMAALFENVERSVAAAGN